MLLLLVGGSGGLLVGSIVGCHHGHCLLCWLLHHLHVCSVWRVLLVNKIHHGKLRWHGHGCTYTAGLRHALHRVVRHLWELLWALLLLGATGGGGVRLHAKGRMDLCIPATDPPMMLALVAFGLCVGPRFPHLMLVWESSTSPPWVLQ